ncbi:hypothetical protein C0991_007898 [Blastosporella zonata]|nr:hypothetical protein C0991_007898 [Blastosporella zonata]
MVQQERMHQEHNIPWNALASNFKFIRDNPNCTPRTYGIWSRQLPTQAESLNHFKRILHNTITTFSKTERQKYPTTFTAPASGNLFSDELRDRHPEFLNEKNQSIEFWIASAKHGGYIPRKPGYSTRDGALANAIKVLISENEMAPLLMLAHHPDIPLPSLQTLSWGHHFGFCRIQESALHVYVMLNMWAAMGLLEGGEYLEVYDYKWMLSHSTHNMDYAGHQVAHREYFNKLPQDKKTGLPMVHHDFAALKEYVKTNFRLLYLYDMFLKEFGLDPRWESEIAVSFRFGTGKACTKLEVVGDRSYTWCFA